MGLRVFLVHSGQILEYHNIKTSIVDQHIMDNGRGLVLGGLFLSVEKKQAHAACT